MKTPLVAFIAAFLCTSTYAQYIKPVNSGELIEKGIELHGEEKYKEAIALYKQIPHTDTNYVLALYEMAYSASLDSNHAFALASINEALTLDYDDLGVEFLQLQASVIDDMGNTERAIRLYDSALIKYPNAQNILLNKAISYIRLDRYNEAEKVLQNLLLRNPYYASAHFRLGICALQKGHMAKAMMCFFTYLINNPSGPFHNSAISMLSEISKNTDGVVELVSKRKEDAGKGFSLLEQILFSKIALDKNYKVLTGFDDPIIRQLQVMMEKLQYDSNNNDFWMQFYVPYLKAIFDKKHFEPAVYYAFSNVEIDDIQKYLKRKSKEVKQFAAEVNSIFEKVRTTRELDFQKRQAMPAIYHFNDRGLFAKGELNNKDLPEGVWEFYHKNGNVNLTGQFNRNGEKTGKWTYYFNNGKINGFDNWVDGKQHGEDVTYNKQGIVIARANYVNGNLQGERKAYFEVGHLKSITPYINGVEEGKYVEYFSTGRKKVEAQVAKDKLHGSYKTFYNNGNPEYIVNYENGKLHGKYKYHHENGKLSFECTYVNGEIEGEGISYHPNGTLKKKLNYIKGLAEGEEIEYNDAGVIVTTSTYRKGKIDGTTKFFDDDGKLYSTFQYDNAVLKEAKYFDKKGNLVSTSTRKSKLIDLFVYSPQGIKRSSVTYNDDLNITGKNTFFFPSGKIKETNSYKDGKLEGISTGYFPNGKKKYELTYSNGERNGLSRYFYANGQLQSEAWYVNDNLYGDFIEYNEKGVVIIKSYYQDGELHGTRTWYYANGKLNDEEIYNNGWLTGLKDYDTTGKLLYSVEFREGKGKYSGVYFNNKISVDGEMLNGQLHGKFTGYYADGSISSEKTYEYGRLHGAYIEYNIDGRPGIKGQYHYGDRTGTWMYYTLNGKLWKTENYTDGLLEGKLIFYNDAGGVEIENTYKNGERNGISKRFYEDGQLAYEYYYKDDEITGYSYLGTDGKMVPVLELPGSNGKFIAYYQNGNKAAEMEYVDGSLHGNYVRYHPNGKIQYQSTELYGHTDGKVTEYFADGSVLSTYTYILGEADGPFKLYHKNGKVKEEGSYELGYYNGDRRIYDENSKLVQTLSYYQGVLIKSTK